MTSADGWEAWEKGCTAMGEVVKSLKTGGGAKQKARMRILEGGGGGSASSGVFRSWCKRMVRSCSLSPCV